MHVTPASQTRAISQPQRYQAELILRHPTTSAALATHGPAVELQESLLNAGCSPVCGTRGICRRPVSARMSLAAPGAGSPPGKMLAWDPATLFLRDSAPCPGEKANGRLLLPLLPPLPAPVPFPLVFFLFSFPSSQPAQTNTLAAPPFSATDVQSQESQPDSCGRSFAGHVVMLLPPAAAPRAGCPAPCPVSFRVSLRTGSPQPPGETCATAQSHSHGKSGLAR